MALTANLRTKILDFRGFGSSGILIVRGGVLMSTGSFPESSSQQILAGAILVGRSGATNILHILMYYIRAHASETLSSRAIRAGDEEYIIHYTIIYIRYTIYIYILYYILYIYIYTYTLWHTIHYTLYYTMLYYTIA